MTRSGGENAFDPNDEITQLATNRPPAQPAGPPDAAAPPAGPREPYRPEAPGAGQWLLDRYELLRRLGRGGMGLVWLARDHELEREVAVKMVPPEVAGDPKAKAQLREEAQAAIRLAHPNIVTLQHFHRQGDVMFLEMEFVNGPSLAEVLHDRKRIPEARVRAWMIDLCLGLEEAHRHGVIHRDIKPANLLLAPDGTLKISDFGIARVVADTTSRLTSQTVAGTLPYMAPEQLRGDPPDARSDLYAVGITAYELLTGRPPFWRGDVTYQHLHESPAPIEHEAPTLWPTIARLLAKKPADRFADAPTLARALRSDAAPAPEAIPAANNRRRLGWAAAVALLSLVAASAWLGRSPSEPKDTRTDTPSPSVVPGAPVAPDERPAAGPTDTFAARVLRLLEDSAPPPAPVTAPAPALQFEIYARQGGTEGVVSVADGDALRSGVDEYVLMARGLTPGYLYIFQVDPRGNVFWLFPANPMSDYSAGANPVAAGTMVQVPADGRVLWLDEVAGVERVFAVYSATPWPDLEAALGEGPSDVDIPGSDVPSFRDSGNTGALAGGLGATKRFQVAMAVPQSNEPGRGDLVLRGAEPAAADVQILFGGAWLRVTLEREPVTADGHYLVIERWFRHVSD